jgi:hypothetical protein
MFKEMKMKMKTKKNLLPAALLCALLTAVMLAAACSTDDCGDGRLPAPAPEDLPDLPQTAGAAMVSTKAEAEALLDGLSSEFQAVKSQVSNLIANNYKETDDGGTWNVDTSLSELKITSKGSETQKSNVENLEDMKAGSFQEMSGNSDTVVEFTADKTASGVTVYQGSRIAEKTAVSGRLTIKSINESTGQITANGSGSETTSYAYGLTASYNGKAGKIIFEAGITGSVNKDLTFSFEDVDGLDDLSVVLTYSGSLVVYGADNTEVYRLDIADEEEFDEAEQYF